MNEDYIGIGQTALRIRLSTGLTASQFDTAVIKYKKPDGVTSGEWTAVKDTDGSIYYDIDSAGDLDQAGTWVFWSYVTTSAGDNAPGKPVRIKIWEEGS